MRAYAAKDGKPLWFHKDYQGPAMIHGDTVLEGQGAKLDLIARGGEIVVNRLS